jgi:aspartate/glutamate racemase
MKRIGLPGGMSWESSAVYYRPPLLRRTADLVLTMTEPGQLT